jgi:hypothetical protein
MNYTIDRFEGNFALCEDESGSQRQIPLSALPETAREGDIITEKDGAFTVNEEATEKRREKMQQRLNRLFK